MIKRIRFATQAEDVDWFDVRWRDAATGAASAPEGVRPSRIAVCTVLPDVTPDPAYDGIGLEWFDDAAHVARFETWLGSPEGKRVDDVLAEAVDPETSPVLLAEPHVMRGQDWLDQRWRDGGSKLKHMAIARRADGLTPARFAELWGSRAGKVGTVVIPDEARGLAYVQNRPTPDGDWAYDAVNEVYFDDVDGLRTRIEWFARNLEQQGGETDLVSEAWFVAVREELLS